MNKDNFIENFTIKLFKIDIILMLVNMILNSFSIDASIVANQYQYSCYVDDIICLPIFIACLIIIIIDYPIIFITKRKPSDKFINIQLCIGGVIWFIYLVSILLLKFFYDDFENILNEIVRFISPGVFWHS
ncbi:MAG: hypothetical protein LUC92_01110 [Clostridiales bacterium]|nr:hypothetical protein [Clostridiales bacterium]